MRTIVVVAMGTLVPGWSTHGSRHDEVGLRVEVAAEHVVAVAFQGLQTLPLEAERERERERESTSVPTQHMSLHVKRMSPRVTSLAEVMSWGCHGGEEVASYRADVPDLQSLVVGGGDQEVGV